MFRATKCVLDNSIFRPVDLSAIIEIGSCYQCVRWKRKPRWMPTAKSKVFRVPERYKTPEEERVELTRLKNCYNTQMKAVRQYLRLEHQYTTITSELSPPLFEEIEEDHAMCKKLNDEWNMQVAKVREERLIREAEVERESILQKLLDYEQKECEELEKIEQIVREEKVRAASYITVDNIDEAIEAALATQVDLNFSIDLDGNMYHGRTTKPPEEEKKLKSVQAG